MEGKQTGLTGAGHTSGDGRLGARLRQPHPSEVRFFKGDSHSSTEGIPI